jgi:hypothetical protein
MTPAIWIESTVSERTANLRGEAERQRLAQLVGSGRRDGKARHGVSGRRVGTVEWLGGRHPRCADPVAAARSMARPRVLQAGRRPVVSGAKWPARYEVRVDGVLDGRWSDWFDGLRIEHQGGQTLLSGVLADQPALHGILDKVRDLGLSIIAVRRLPPPEEAEAQG